MPLNETLFRQLQRRFGEVVIANENESAITSSSKDSSGRRRLEVTYAGEYYVTQCPFCSDTARHLWINHRFEILSRVVCGRLADYFLRRRLWVV